MDAFIGSREKNQPSSDQDGPRVNRLFVVIELKKASNTSATNSSLKYIHQCFVGRPMGPSISRLRYISLMVP